MSSDELPQGLSQRWSSSDEDNSGRKGHCVSDSESESDGDHDDVRGIAAVTPRKGWIREERQSELAHAEACADEDVDLDEDKDEDEEHSDGQPLRAEEENLQPQKSDERINGGTAGSNGTTGGKTSVTGEELSEPVHALRRSDRLRKTTTSVKPAPVIEKKSKRGKRVARVMND